MSTKKYESIRNSVLKKILPSEQEKKKALEMYEKIESYLKIHQNVKSKLMGSVAKNTFISGNKDLDIFIFFDLSISREKLEAKSLEIGQKTFKHFRGHFEIKYAEHPYVKGQIKNFSVEIVPCYKLKFIERIKSAVDRTPFHTLWINKNLTLKAKEDVVLLKQFLSANKLYGSSLKIEGFSGYLCEILIHHYGSFEKFVIAAKKWKRQIIIDPQNHWKKLPPDLVKLFKDHSLIVIDPVDRNRNVAAVLSNKNFEKCQTICGQFVKNSSKNFFEFRQIKVNLSSLKKKLNLRKIYYIELEKLEIIEDILYPQLRKSSNKITRYLKEQDILVIQSGIYEGQSKMRIVLEVENDSVPKEKEITGPPLKEKDHVTVFKKKYKKTWEKDKRITTKIIRETTSIKKMYHIFIQKLEVSGIPKNMLPIFENTTLKKVSVSGKKWQEFLTEFMVKEK